MKMVLNLVTLLGIAVACSCSSGSRSASTASTTSVGTSSPDVAAGRIVFGLHTDDVDAVYTAATDGSHRREILGDKGECCFFSLSADGRRMMVAVDVAGGRLTTATLDTDGHDYHAVPLPKGALGLAPGAWSPDGSLLALDGWAEHASAQVGIYTVRSSDGGELRRITTPPDGREDIPFSYSPDGSLLLFGHVMPRPPGYATDHPDPLQLYVVRADGRIEPG